MPLLNQREAAASLRLPDEALLTMRDVCRLFGGSRPIDPATLYRWIKAGRCPRPVKIGPGSSRWLRAECEAALAVMIAGRAA